MNIGPCDLQISEEEYTYTKDVVVPLACAWHEQLLAFPPLGIFPTPQFDLPPNWDVEAMGEFRKEAYASYTHACNEQSQLPFLCWLVKEIYGSITREG